MPPKIIKWMECQRHGRVIKPCVQCRTEKYQQLLKDGKIKSIPDVVGDGPEPGELSPMQIALRAKKERNDREEEENETYEEFDLTAAEEVIRFIKEAIPESISFTFWNELQVGIDQELGKTSPLQIMSMGAHEVEAFMETEIPFGKYQGRRVRQVWKYDPHHLIKLCYKPSLFQAKLRRMLYTLDLLAE